MTQALGDEIWSKPVERRNICLNQESSHWDQYKLSHLSEMSQTFLQMYPWQDCLLMFPSNTE